ncbi:hypothetical protein F4818DRAFT_444630 [Hypoxylon cercidicola]|nr:hypothetical protein F4818DRAFT_444630 [Hypoxylon cercidicola]
MSTTLITGANQGKKQSLQQGYWQISIGRALVGDYLSRPNQTVIGAVRSEGSKLLVVKIEATSETDPAVAMEQIKAAGINAHDVVIAVPGTNPASAFAEVKDMDVNAMRDIFDVNTFSFVSLFKAVHPLLEASTSAPKLLVISSNGSQIVEMEPTIPVKVGIYGASEAALNYLVRRARSENPWLAAWVMNPGFVQ